MAEMFDLHDYLEELDTFLRDATRNYALQFANAEEAIVLFVYHLLGELKRQERKDGATTEEVRTAHWAVIDGLVAQLDYYRTHGGVWQFEHDLGTRR